MSVRQLIVAVAIACSLPAQAAVIDGNALRDDLQFEKETESKPRDETSYRSGRIIGYLVGVFDALEGLGLFCPPSSEGIGAISGSVRKYIDANRDGLARPANVVIVDALKSAYPCGAKPN